MARLVSALDQRLDRLSRAQVTVLAACGVLIVGGLDYVTGYEVSMSLLYLGPIAMAVWYAARWTGVATAVLSCLSWYIADTAAGDHYSHPAIPVWNALVRLGFFLITALLLNALHRSLRNERRLARTDVLTGLYGRRAFEDRLAHDLALAQRREGPLTLAYVDVDDFKAVNDKHGHAAGDRVLQTVGRGLERTIRESDTAARIGGDEFALILPDTDANGAKQVIAKLQRELHGSLGTGRRPVTCSIGVVTFVGLSASPEDLVVMADAVMYQVKRQGKGAVAYRVVGEDTPPAADALHTPHRSARR